MKLIVTAPSLLYGGKRYAHGEAFEAAPKDAKVLKAIRKAADVTPDAPVRPPVGHVATVSPPAPAEPVEAKGEDAPEPAVEVPSEPEAPVGRHYRTRRLTAKA